MWGDWLEKGKELASKAQAAALELDKQINQSVGITDAPTLASELIEEDDDILNDAWDGDNDDLAALDDDSDQKAASKPLNHSDNQSHDSEPQEELEAFVSDPSEHNDHVDHVNDLMEVHEPVDNAFEKSEGHDTERITFTDKERSSGSENDDAALSTPSTEPKTTDAKVDEHGPYKNLDEEQKQEKAEVVHADSSPTEEGWEVGNDDLDMIDTSENDQQHEEMSEDVSSSRIANANTDLSTEVEATAVGSILPLEIQQTDEGELLTIPPNAFDEELNTEMGEKMTATSYDEQSSAEVSEKLKFPEDAETHTEVSSFRPLDDSDKEDKNKQNGKSLEDQVIELNHLLRQREEQLMNKTEQLTEMTSMFESEKQQLLQKVASTKEEAKRRTQKAKERVEVMEARLKEISRQSTAGDQDAAKQAEIIAALREEGEKLAHKQAEMEKAVRTAKGEARTLREQLEYERTAKDTAIEKIENLESELKKTKDDLSSARRGESQAEKLDNELRRLTEENNTKATTILSLEQQIQELKATMKHQEVALQEVQQGAEIETEREIKKIRKEHNDAICDLETKLHTTEREAGIREDALRHEIEELRKRWQDSVRRADSLSMDIQSSTAPLLRQIESTERQSRSRAAAWAELESSLRSQLEEAVISNEQLSKEKSDLKSRNSRAERAVKEYEAELKMLKYKLDEQAEVNQHLQDKVNELELTNAKIKEEYSEVQRLANEGVSKVRSEMSKTVMDSEERHQAQLESLRRDLGQEREKRSLLEKQVEELVDKAGMIVPPLLSHSSSHIPETQPVRLRQSENQFDILNDALGGLGSDDEDESDEQAANHHGDTHGSFAALAELTNRLKAAKAELDVLKKQLVESQGARDRMTIELNETRLAKEKLPLFETKVQELTRDNEEMAMEIQSLQEDIAEVKEMYRTQLNALLEEKALRVQDRLDATESAVETNNRNIPLEHEFET